jgi:Fe2+ or Zn2+ uptake regulation protein
MMNQQEITSKQKSVLSVLNNQHLTSVEILNEAKSIPHILTLYSILDELRNMGMIQSYMKQNLKYHVAI